MEPEYTNFPEWFPISELASMMRYPVEFNIPLLWKIFLIAVVRNVSPPDNSNIPVFVLINDGIPQVPKLGKKIRKILGNLRTK